MMSHKKISWMLAFAMMALLFLGSTAEAKWVKKWGRWYWRTRVPCSTSRTGWCWKDYYVPRYAVPQRRLNEYSASAGGTEGWRKDLTEMLKSYQKYQSQIAASANEQNEYLEALNKIHEIMGTRGYAPTLANPRRGFAGVPQQVLQGGYQYAPYAQQGSTVYGYSEYAKAYRDIDPMVLLNQASNHTRRAQELGPESEKLFKSMVSEVVDGQARIAEIEARAQAAARVLSATDPQEQTETRRTWIKVEQGKNGELELSESQQPPPAAQGNQAARQALAELLANRCISCHNQEKASGGFDLTQYFTYSPEQKVRVRQAVTWTHPNKSKWMPRTKDGELGKKLNFNELMLFRQ